MIPFVVTVGDVLLHSETNRLLEENIRDGESAPLASLGWPTLVTLARGVLFSVVAGFLVIPFRSGRALKVVSQNLAAMFTTRRVPRST